MWLPVADEDEMPHGKTAVAQETATDAADDEQAMVAVTDGRWVLLTSVQVNDKPTQYFVGDFDGYTFTALQPQQEIRRIDGGQDFYAVQSWYGLRRRIWIGWMLHWAYAHHTPTEAWRGLFTVPRAISLCSADGRMHIAQRPIDVLAALRDGAALSPSVSDGAAANGGSEWQWRALSPRYAYEVIFGAARRPWLAYELTVYFGAARQERLRIRVDDAAVTVDRSRCCDGAPQQEFRGNEGYIAVHHAPLLDDDRRIVPVQVIIDSCSAELFAQNGLISITNLIFPIEPIEGMIFRIFDSTNGRRDERDGKRDRADDLLAGAAIGVYRLRPVWDGNSDRAPSSNPSA